MSDSRGATVSGISHALCGRDLVWVGTRGTDAQPLYCLEEFRSVVSIVAPLGLGRQDGCSETCLEEISGVRVDLNAYSIDEDPSEHLHELQQNLLTLLTGNVAVAAYRPSEVLASAYYPRQHIATFLGMFHAHQGAFDYKPWVESELARAGVSTIRWRYFGPDDSEVLREITAQGSWVFRPNRSDGGLGIRLVEPGTEDFGPLPAGWYAAVSRYLEPTVPLNVSGCVFPDGTVTVRNPSLQLIGIDGCTSRRFGYCGNDFSAVESSLNTLQFEQFETFTRRAGTWLHQMGYRGAFGVDALASQDQVLLAEINPRFQGCSAASAEVAQRLGASDVYLDHLSAWLGLDAPECLPLAEQARLQASPDVALSQAVIYNTSGSPLHFDLSKTVPFVDADPWCLPRTDVAVDTEGIMYKLLVDRQITQDGYSIVDEGLMKDSESLAALYGER